jgi:hypothetical protein
MEPKPNDPSPPRYFTRPSARALASVCRSWRAAALDIPFLWTALCHVLPEDVAQAFAARSSERPFDCAFCLPMNHKHIRDTSKGFLALYRHITRTLIITSVASRCLDAWYCLHYFGHGMPVLETLIVNAQLNIGHRGHASHVHLLTSLTAPTLKRCTLWTGFEIRETMEVVPPFASWSLVRAPSLRSPPSALSSKCCQNCQTS